MTTTLKEIALTALRTATIPQSFVDAVVHDDHGKIIAMCAGEVVRLAWNDALYKRHILLPDIPPFRSNLGRTFMWFNDRHQMNFEQIAELIDTDQFLMEALDDEAFEALKARFPLPANAPQPPKYKTTLQYLEDFANGREFASVI